MWLEGRQLATRASMGTSAAIFSKKYSVFNPCDHHISSQIQKKTTAAGHCKEMASSVSRRNYTCKISQVLLGGKQNKKWIIIYILWGHYVISPPLWHYYISKQYLGAARRGQLSYCPLQYSLLGQLHIQFFKGDRGCATSISVFSFFIFFSS